MKAVGEDAATWEIVAESSGEQRTCLASIQSTVAWYDIVKHLPGLEPAEHEAGNPVLSDDAAHRLGIRDGRVRRLAVRLDHPDGV